MRTTYEYDDLNRLDSVIENDVPGSNPTDESDVTTTYGYDALGNRTNVINAKAVTSTYTIYDTLNRPHVVEDALGNQTVTEYNALGYRTVMTGGNDAVTTYAYDNLNRLEAVNYTGDGEVVSYSYDAAGNRTQMTDALGTTTYQYDDLYRLGVVTDTFAAVIEYDYDLVGNRTGLTYPDSKHVTYVYDGDNRMVQVVDWDSGTTSYQYDPAGRLITTTLPNEVQTISIYDDANRLVELTHTAADSSLIVSFSYELDGVGNRITTTETIRQPGQVGAVLPTTISYDYDRLYRLAEASYTGEITATYTYAYDAVGNMYAYTETVGIETTAVNRTFDDANQLQTATDAAAGTTSFYYDDNGNLVQILPPGANPGDAGEQLYTFNQRNLLTTYQLGQGSSVYSTVAEYGYDGEGNRVQQVDYSGSTAVTTTYTNDNSGLSQVLVSDDGTAQTHSLIGLSLIHQDDGTETRTLLADGLGSVRTELMGSVIETVTTYEPYGKLLAQTGSTGTVYGYTREQQDAASGLVYLRARYYNPYLNQFQSRDPFPGYAKLPASQNGYSYVSNNPINRVDPSGLCEDYYYADETCWRIAVELAKRDSNPNHDLDFFASMSYELLLDYRDNLILLQAEVNGVSGLIEFFEVYHGPADVRLEQLLRQTGYMQQQFGIRIPGGASLCSELEDQVFYDTLWGGGTSFQMSHFLTAVSLAYNNLNPNGPPFSTNIYRALEFESGGAFRDKDSMDVALKLIIGHELISDTAPTDWIPEGRIRDLLRGPTQPLAWPLQYNAATNANVIDFISAIEADSTGDTATRDALLRSILGTPSGRDAVPSRVGNSFQDLLLSLKGVEFGGGIRLGTVTSSQDAALWLKSNLTH